MDVLSVLGLVIVTIAIVGGWLVGGGDLSILFDGSTIVILFGGIFGAAMIQSQISIFVARPGKYPRDLRVFVCS